MVKKRRTEQVCGGTLQQTLKNTSSVFTKRKGLKLRIHRLSLNLWIDDNFSSIPANQLFCKLD